VSDRLRTAKEIADVLGVPESWVREHTRSGAIPHVQLGRYKRYDPGDVLGWVESLKAGGGPRFRKYLPRAS
jgi:excisionase family DNA binding protein